MVGTWGFTEATNTVVVTDGTSEAPATFADFVTADRAGTATLLAAAACAKTMTLTYPVRPVEFRALQITFTIASKTAQTDYLWITGTDAWGTALYECIDISAGNGAYVSTQYFATITNIDVEDVGDGSGTAAADGTVAVTQDIWGVIWDYGNSCQYQIDCTSWDIGDNSTATYFTSKNEAAYFSDNVAGPRIRYNGTLQMGELSNSYPVHGSYWSWGIGSTFNLVDWSGSEFYCYGSILKLRRDNNRYMLLRFTAPVVFRNVMIFGSNSGAWNQDYIFFNHGDTSFYDVYLAGLKMLYINQTPTAAENVWVHDPYSIGLFLNQGSMTIRGPRVTSATYDYNTATAGTEMIVIDPIFPITSPSNNQNTSWIKQCHSCNITVTDKDGTLLDGVVVDCEDTNTDAVWTAGTVETGDTDIGKIDEQIITYKRWIDNTETLTTYSPHKFTFTKAGYETLILENITVDAPIVWHLELQPQQYITDGMRHNV